MKLYKIRDWDKYFENNRSRELKCVNWVVVPNKHDGENYSLLMRHQKAAEIFSAWVLMLQIASKCIPRGVLIKGNGAAHSPHSLAAKSQAPAGWFELAIDYLCEHTDWLEVIELTDSKELKCGIIAPQCGITARRDEEGKGMEGKEGKGRELLSETPSWNEFWEYCKIHGLGAEWYARDKFLAAGSDNWKGKSNWQIYADRCRSWWEQDGRPTKPPPSKHAPKKYVEPTL